MYLELDKFYEYVKHLSFSNYDEERTYWFSYYDYSVRSRAELAYEFGYELWIKDDVLINDGYRKLPKFDVIKCQRQFAKDDVMDRQEFKKMNRLLSDQDFYEKFMIHLETYISAWDRYFDYEYDKVKSMLAMWCKENGIVYKKQVEDL